MLQKKPKMKIQLIICQSCCGENITYLQTIGLHLKKKSYHRFLLFLNEDSFK